MIYLSDRSKMILKLLGLFLVAGAIGFALFMLFFAHKPAVTTPTTTPGETGTTSGLPSAGQATPGTTVTTPGGAGSETTLPVSPVANGGVTTTTVLTTAAVYSPTITSSGKVAYYNPGDGHFYTIDKNGSATLLSSANFPDAQAVTFSAGATEAVVEFPDGSNVAYNFSTQTQSTLPAHWDTFSFTADGSEIATKSITTDVSARALVISAADGSTATAVAALGSNADAVTVNWSPDGSVLGFSATGGGESFGQNNVYIIGANGSEAGVLIVNGSNFSAIWSPDSNHLLYSIADASQQEKATLWYADKDGDRKTDTRKEISLQTSVSKCVFASDSAAYCAVPTTMPAGGGSSSSLITAPDNLYKISFPALTTTLVASPAVSTQMSNLQIDATGSTLYYTDKNGRLNYLRLK